MTATTFEVACLTPAGSAALAIVGVRGGPEVPRLVKMLFDPRRPGPIDHRPRLGRLRGAILDEVVLVAYDDRVEICCPGGHLAVREVIDLFCRHGGVEISWEEWLRRGAATPIAGEAAVALSRARTSRAAALLLDQMHGALEKSIRELQVAVSDGSYDAAAKIDSLIDCAAVGLHLLEPFRVVLAGPTNAGKSSLLNAILGFSRAIVSPAPGTTRDLVSGLTALDGWLVEFIDTAGERDALFDADEIEAAGIARARAARHQADLVLWLTDASRGTAVNVLPTTACVVKTLLVANKIDLVAGAASLPAAAFPVSALTGAGLPDLLAAIVQQLVPKAPPPGAAVPFTPRQVAALQAARRALIAGCRADARRALDSLVVPFRSEFSAESAGDTSAETLTRLE